MFVRDTWKPCGFEGQVESLDIRDPESNLYQKDRAWYLVSTPEDLTQFHWPDNCVVCVCIEAVRERTKLGPWRLSLEPLFFLYRSDTAGIPVGEDLRIVDPDDRFILRDLAYKFAKSEGSIYR